MGVLRFSGRSMANDSRVRNMTKVLVVKMRFDAAAAGYGVVLLGLVLGLWP